MEKYTIERIDSENALLIIYNKRYQIHSVGIVKNPKGYTIKGNDNGRGYKSVQLSGGKGNAQRLYVHRLVAEAFIEPIDGKSHVNHINGIKDDNRVENLEWTNQLENNRHAHRIGIANSTGQSKSVVQMNKDKSVIKIWKSCAEAARYYNCTKELINQAARKTCTTCLSAKGYLWEYEEDAGKR